MSGILVNRPYPDSNVGSNLSSLAGALWVASRLGRDLVVDWRGQRQLRDPELNYFSEFFALPETVGGVRVHRAPVEGLDYAEGAEGAAWLEPGEARRVAAGRPAGLPCSLVLQTYHGLDRVHPGPESERFRLLRSLFRQLRPAPRIEAAVEAWSREHLDAGFVVGVNVRTGNGAYFGGGMRYASRVDVSVFDDRRRFLRLLERACRSRLRRFPRTLRDDFRIFYATDSEEMSELLAGLPNAVTRRRVFPPAGSGDLYAFPGEDYTDRDAIEDTLADMFLLARCDALVYNTSLFNQYARVVTGYFGGNHVHFESLLLRSRVRRLLGTAWGRTRFRR
jgi:hypothetical protein